MSKRDDKKFGRGFQFVNRVRNAVRSELRYGTTPPDTVWERIIANRDRILKLSSAVISDEQRAAALEAVSDQMMVYQRATKDLFEDVSVRTHGDIHELPDRDPALAYEQDFEIDPEEFELECDIAPLRYDNATDGTARYCLAILCEEGQISQEEMDGAIRAYLQNAAQSGGAINHQEVWGE